MYLAYLPAVMDTSHCVWLFASKQSLMFHEVKTYIAM